MACINSSTIDHEADDEALALPFIEAACQSHCRLMECFYALREAVRSAQPGNQSGTQPNTQPVVQRQQDTWENFVKLALLRYEAWWNVVQIKDSSKADGMVSPFIPFPPLGR